jgi:pSer/pThr/pTyr-binding forkhead associated (FHA) protein
VRFEKVSRYHCLIYVDDNQNVFVKDLNSSNGTFVNNKKIDRIQVYENDVLQVGPERFVFIIANKHATSKFAVGSKSILLHPRFKEKIECIQLKLVEENSKRYPLPANSIYTIGRLQFSDIFLDDLSVSKRHATIDVREDRVIITDASSKNGTFVNGEWITQHELCDGDIVNIGRKYQFGVSFERNTQNVLTSLQKHVNFYIVDIFAEYAKIMELFQEEYGEQVLSEIARQATLLCEESEPFLKIRNYPVDFQQELEPLLKSHDSLIFQPKKLTKLLQMLSKAAHISDGTLAKEGLQESASLQQFGNDTLSQIEDIIKIYKHHKMIYFEEILPDNLIEVKVNGLMINFESEFQILLLGIPYENIIYFLNALKWLSQPWLENDKTI